MANEKTNLSNEEVETILDLHMSYLKVTSIFPPETTIQDLGEQLEDELKIRGIQLQISD